MSPITRRLLRTLCVLEGRTGSEVQKLVGYSKATFKRYVGDLRSIGAKIEYDGTSWHVRDPGPFDMRKLAQTRLMLTR